MHRTTPTIFLGHCPLPGQANTRISWYKPHSVIVLSNFVVTYVLIKYIYVYSRLSILVLWLSIYFLISRSLISVKVISRSLFFEKLFSGLTFSHPPLPPPHTCINSLYHNLSFPLSYYILGFPIAYHALDWSSVVRFFPWHINIYTFSLEYHTSLESSNIICETFPFVYLQLTFPLPHIKC